MKNTINHIKWTEVFVFYIVAILFSAPFRLGLISLENLMPLPDGLNVFYRVLRGIGPFIGYLTVFFILKSKVEKEISFGGKNSVISFISVIPIVLGLTIAGIYNKEQISVHYYGFLSGLTLFIYALFEEYGWRGYLQQALKPLKLPVRIFVIGTLWYVWHLNFLHPHIQLQSHLIHYVSIILGTWGLLNISEVTSSLVFASSVHLIFNILVDLNAAFTAKLFIVLTSIIIWTLLIIYLKKQENRDKK